MGSASRSVTPSRLQTNTATLRPNMKLSSETQGSFNCAAHDIKMEEPDDDIDRDQNNTEKNKNNNSFGEDLVDHVVDHIADHVAEEHFVGECVAENVVAEHVAGEIAAETFVMPGLGLASPRGRGWCPVIV